MANSKNRTSQKLSSTNKDFATDSQDRHADGKSKQHAHDVIQSRIQREKWNKTTAINITNGEQNQEAMNQSGFQDKSPTEGVSDLPELELTGDFVETLTKSSDGNWSQTEGAHWMQFIRDERKKRDIYRDAHGKTFDRSKYPIKPNNSEKKFPEPLKMIFFRLPPWIASNLDIGRDEQLIRDLKIEIAELFEKETGLPVISINSHKESEHDLHFHLGYSIIKEVPVYQKVTVAKQKSYLRGERAKVREELKYAGKSAHSSDVKKEMERLDITAPKEIEIGTEYRRVVMHTRSFTGDKEGRSIAARSMKILGSSYRNKAHLLDAAVTTADKEHIRTFRELNSDFEGSFTKKFCKLPNPAEVYLDYWMEKTLSEMLMESAPQQLRNKFEASKRQSVSDYIEYGTSTPPPHDKAILKREVTITKSEREIAEEKKTLEIKSKQISKSEYEQKERDHKSETDGYQADILLEIVVEKEAAVSKRASEYDDKLSKLKAKEENIDAQLELENRKLEDRSEKLQQRAERLHSRELNLASKENEFKETGRREILDEISSVAFISKKEPEKKHLSSLRLNLSRTSKFKFQNSSTRLGF